MLKIFKTNLNLHLECRYLNSDEKLVIAQANF